MFETWTSEPLGIEPLLEGRLVFVTGKGGTGKSTIAAALAVLAAARGRRVLLAELDMSRPAMTGLFGVEPGNTPTRVHPRLDLANVQYRPSLEAFIGSVVPVRRVVRRVVNNPIIERFLDFTPGAREMVTLSAVVEHTRDYDLVIVDLPASGHAFSLLDVTRSALGLFRSGPMRARAQQLRDTLEKDSSRVAMVALPEPMVVNETLETHARFDAYGLLGRDPVVLLNRGTLPSLADEERTLLDRLAAHPLGPEAAEFVGAGLWESQLELETSSAMERLRELAEPVLVPPATEGGKPWEVLTSVVVNLGRGVGVTRRMLPNLALPVALDGPSQPVEHGAGSLDVWLAERKLVVTVGSGGVGKTTTAAALGLYAARRGRKAMVLTIDPAKRLANSLGLEAFGNAETQIALEAEGELWAMMLDSRSTMDSLIARIAEPDVAERIFANHVYRHMADTFAGSQDYMATEKLYDLVSSDRWDLVVLDTPPVKNALDFLESPGRLLNFLDEKVLAWFLTPDERGWTGLMWGTQAVVRRLLGHVFGREFLDDLAVFFTDFQGLYDGFRERHEAVVTLLRSPETHFVTVCSPTQSSLDVAQYFVDELGHRGLPRGGVIVNQVHHCEGTDHDAARVLLSIAHELGADLPPRTVPSVIARLGTAHRRLRNLVDAERELIGRLETQVAGAGFYREIPRLPGQVHDLDALDAVGAALFAASAPGVR